MAGAYLRDSEEGGVTMPRPGETNTCGQRWVGAPYQSPARQSSAVVGVWLSEGEEVEWHWCHSMGAAGGSYVNGYTVTRRADKVLKAFGEEEEG